MADMSILRQLYEERRLGEAWQEYERLLREAPLEASGHLVGGLVARLRGELRHARRAFELGLQLDPQGSTLGKLRMTLGAIMREMGDTSASIEMLERFITDMDQYPDLRPLAKGAAHHNLALAYRCARRLDDARGAYETAVREFRSENMRDYLQQSLRNLAWLCCLMGDTRKAEEALAEVDDLCKTDGDRWHWRVGMAFLSFAAGDRTDALQRCEAIIQASESVHPGIVSHACWVAGRVGLALGQFDQAEIMARQALDWACRSKDDVRQMQDANDLRREIYQTRLHRKQSGA